MGTCRDQISKISGKLEAYHEATVDTDIFDGFRKSTEEEISFTKGELSRLGDFLNAQLGSRGLD